MKNINNSDSSIDKLFEKYSCARDILENELNSIFKISEDDNNSPIEHIKSRIKTYDSIKNKLNSKNKKFNQTNIKKYVHDVVGIRIVCTFLSDVEYVVKEIKKSNKFIITEENDYIKNPKSSGYISYHLNVLVKIDDNEYVDAEIQIRTVAMDFWASLDHKLRYKNNTNIPIDIINEVYSCSQIISDLDLKMENLRKKII